MNMMMMMTMKMNSSQYYNKFVYVSMKSTRYYCQIFIKLEFSRRVFEKYSNKNFMKIRAVEAEFKNGDRQKDEWANMKPIVVFRNSLTASNIRGGGGVHQTAHS
jgi:hypothetical protein